MHFIDEKGGALGLVDAAALGLPPGASSGVFSPASDADLRPAVYAPDSSYPETAASAIAALFPEDIDPIMAERLAERAFSRKPATFSLDGDILVADYRSGPSASAADISSAFLAGILGHAARRRGPMLLLADGSGCEGAALAEAVSGLRDLRLALLYPEPAQAEGLNGAFLKREGGQSRILSLRANRLAADRLIREAAGGKLAGMSVAAAGPANPARFAARIVRLAASFSILRKGAAGDLYIGVRAGDGFELAACLWAWKLGLPLAGIVLSVSEKGILGLDPAGRRFVERFDAEYPGVIRSLVLMQNVDRASALKSREELRLAGGPELDLASSMSLAAAELALDAGLRGHARIVVPWSVDPCWDEAGKGPGGGAIGFDAEIGATSAELERALTA